MRTKENIMRIIFAVALLACASAAGAEETATKSFSAAGIEALKIDTAAGNIKVKAGNARIAVEVTRFDPELCVLTMAPKGKTFVLKAESRSQTGWFRKGCEAGFQVTAPAALRVSADSGAGNLAIAGLTGALTLNTGAGSISLDAVSGEVRANTGAGSIRGTLSSSKADLYTGAGSIDLAWQKSPVEGRIKADTGTGTVRISFPEGTRLEADLSAGIGSTSSQFEDTKGAGLRVSAASGVGSVSLVKS
jgi:DUF4097 and DUF4098 domain-containing protein YvlB